MRRRIALASATLSAVALIAVAAVPASAGVPGDLRLGKLWLRRLREPRSGRDFRSVRPRSLHLYLIIPEEPGLHVAATQYEVALDGEVIFSKSFGEKAGLTTSRARRRSRIPRRDACPDPDGRGRSAAVDEPNDLAPSRST